MYAEPRFLDAGEAALVVEFADEISLAANARVHWLAWALRAAGLAGLGEAVPSYRSLLVQYDPLRLERERLLGTIRRLLVGAEGSGGPQRHPRLRELPTVYGGEWGPDLPTVAETTGLSEAEVVRRLAELTFTVYMVGFMPGFPYLGTLPPELEVPRLKEPRLVVPQGSVAIAGRQAGVYPFVSPGGWRLLGRTPYQMFDPRREPPAYLAPGDTVRFAPAQPEDWEEAGEVAAVGLAVLDGGLLTTVQDLGRQGFQAYGVPVAGAMDPFALQAANAMVGNPLGEAALELTVVGPRLRATAACAVGLAGADLGARLNGQAIAPWQAYLLAAGDVLEFGGPLSGCRAYLAVAGGLDLPLVLGSRSTYLRGGFGGVEGRALRAGDVLSLRAPGAGALPLRGRGFTPPAYSPEPVVRVVLGPQADRFTPAGLETFLGNTYAVSGNSDRMGARLQGPTIAHSRGPDVISDGIVLGAVQVPGDGQPIIMLADRQTTGGYTKIATVIGADIHHLAQCLPGAGRLRFQAVDVAEAVRLRRAQAAQTGRARRPSRLPAGRHVPRRRRMGGGRLTLQCS